MFNFVGFFSRATTKPMISRRAMIYYKAEKNSLPSVPAPSSTLWPKAKSAVFSFVCQEILFLYVKLNRTNSFLVSHPTSSIERCIIEVQMTKCVKNRKDHRLKPLSTSVKATSESHTIVPSLEILWLWCHFWSHLGSPCGHCWMQHRLAANTEHCFWCEFSSRLILKPWR